MKTNFNLIRISRIFFAVGAMTLLSLNCKQDNDDTAGPPPPPPPPPASNEVDFWLTKGDQTALLQKQTTVLAFGTTTNAHANIEVNEAETFQSVDGFGYTLTGGSAEVINSLTPAKKSELLQDLFGSGENSISVSYLRVSIGASDLNSTPFTYNDMPAGETDVNLTNFSLAPDMQHVIPLLKEILAINPDIKILGSPWSPPVWMKDIASFIGGSLRPEYQQAYANYFVKYVQEMKAQGITIDAITPQNEPLHPGNNPSLYMSSAQQANFIKNNLGPAFQAANINTKIIIYDHNCDNPQYPLDILADPAAKAFVNGSAFHLYNGDISALSTVRNAHPDKAVYFTEQYTPSNGSFDGDLKWHLKNVIIGSMRNWSRVALEWNLANNSVFGPHTPGGCTVCKGGITVHNSALYEKNVGYYIVAHASKFVPPGSVRIASTVTGSLHSAAFKRPDGKRVLIVLNEGTAGVPFNLKFNGKWITAPLPAGSVGSFVW